MYRRYYDGYRNIRDKEESGEIVVPRNSDTYLPSDKNTASITEASAPINVQKNSTPNFWGIDCELDDIILIGILLFLTLDKENTDPIMLIIIGFIFLSELI